MNENWRILKWETVCELSPKIQKAFYDADFESEYGMSFAAFIDSPHLYGLYSFAQEWWNSLSKEKRLSLLTDRKNAIEEEFTEIVNIIEKEKHDS